MLREAASFDLMARWLRLGGAMLLVAGVLAACSDDMSVDDASADLASVDQLADEASAVDAGAVDTAADEFCRLLAEPPLITRWMNTDVIVFLEPWTPAEEIDRLAALAESDPNVLSVRIFGQDEAYEEFVEIFEQEPARIAAVSPEILPASLRMTVVDDSAGVATIEGDRHINRVHDRTASRVDDPAVDQLLRLLTLPTGYGTRVTTPGWVGLSLRLADRAPEAIADDMALLEEHWRIGQTEDEIDEPLDESTVAAARRVVAYYDTECA